MTNFNEFKLPETLLISLNKLKFTQPTPIQEQTIPLALEGNDILGSAQTGSGKTIAFAVPLIAKLLTNDTSCGLIIAPTRELASQVIKALESIIGKSSIKTCLLIGGEKIEKQFAQLKRTPRLFVGTPGRINDHLKRKTLNLRKVDYLVLDEMDRMLDMGFSIQIDEILKHVPKNRQTLLFSATVPHNILKLANSYMNDPKRVEVGSSSKPNENIKHDIIHIKSKEKYSRLVDELNQREGSVIIFMKTKISVDRMSKTLSSDGHSAVGIHGDLQHRKRDKVIRDFRSKKYKILVATDVAARGLDIPHIEHVINHDLPQCPEDYLHRIGRTARAGAKGEAICFISSEDRRKWEAIEDLINPEAKATRRKTSSSDGRYKKNKNSQHKFGKKPSQFKKKFGSDKPKSRVRARA